MSITTSLVKKFIKAVTPPIILAPFRVSPRRSFHFSGPYGSWPQAAANSAGYNSEEIFDKVTASAFKVKRGEAVYERDSVIFNEIQYSWPVLAALLWILARENGHLGVCDFGGALGTSFFQNRKFLAEFPHVRWNIVEQTEFITRGRALIQDDRLRFYPTVKACLKEYPCCVMLLSGVLQYLEEPYRRISELNDYGFHYIIVDRAPLIAADDDVLAVQHVQRNIYKASFPAWFFSERKFLGHFQRDYELIERFDDQLTTLQLGDLLAPMKGFIFRSSKQT